MGSVHGSPRAGGGIHEAAVTAENQLEVRAITEPDIEFISDAEGRAYTWSSTDASAASEECIYIENGDAQRELHIVEVWCSGDADALWTLVGVTSGTAAGTNITAKSMNRQFNITPLGTFKGDAEVTGSVAGDALMIRETLANVPVQLAPPGGIILGQGNAVTVFQDATNNINVTIVGFYEEKVV